MPGMEEHDLDEADQHDEAEYYQHLLSQAVKNDCRCGEGCKRLIIEVEVQDAEREREVQGPQPPQPTDGDRENVRIRREIAERMEAEYVEVLKLALGAFGPGWEPSHRHFLLDKDDEERVRYTEERPKAVATVYTVKSE